jgi:molybdate transport system regulatory protein
MPSGAATPGLLPVASEKGMRMKISARNIFDGKIVGIKKGVTTSHVLIDAKGQIVTASITGESVEELGLKVGDSAKAVIKSSDVLVAVGSSLKISARNILDGKIVDIKKGVTTSHVAIDVKGQIVMASITEESVADLGLKVGDPVKAVIKSSDVLVAVA